jgi:hypothetical protein
MIDTNFKHQELLSTLQKDIEISTAENRDLQRKNKLLKGELDAVRLDMARFLRRLAKNLDDHKLPADEEIPF